MQLLLDYNKKTDDKKINNKKGMNGLKISYLILAHKNPSQLVTLINALDSKEVSFFIHINKNSDIINHRLLEKIKNKKNVFFIKQRKKIAWGGYSIVDATLLLLKECLEKGKCDYISLHSGQDLPIKNKNIIMDYLYRNQGNEFIEFWKIPKAGWGAGNGLERIVNYWFVDEYGFDQSFKIINKHKISNVNRKYFEDIQPYGGSTWWTITRECAEFIIDYTNQNKAFCDYYKYTLLPDEGFFHTIVLNSHFKDKVINSNLRYIEWDTWKPNPKIFTKHDYDKLITSDKLFARKFDINIDNKIIQMITNKIM